MSIILSTLFLYFRKKKWENSLLLRGFWGRIRCTMNLKPTVCDKCHRFLQCVTQSLCLSTSSQISDAASQLLSVFSLDSTPDLFSMSFEIPVVLLRTVTCFFFSWMHSTSRCHLYPEHAMTLPLCGLTESCTKCPIVKPALYLFPVTLSLLFLSPSHRPVYFSQSSILPSSVNTHSPGEAPEFSICLKCKGGHIKQNKPILEHSDSGTAVE